MPTKKRIRSDGEEKAVDPSEEDELEASNIAHVHPHVGMRLEIRDADYIWSSGFIVQISINDKQTMVTVASDGWGRQWDEVMTWPNDRLAKLYTYTKQVKCNLDLIRKNTSRKPSRQDLANLPKRAKRVYSTLWPGTAQFRMPHPGVKHARYALRLEDKVYVKPYGVEFLPKGIQATMVHDGGCWLHHSKIRLWRDDPITCGVLHANYQQAFQIARRDQTVKGLLRVKALEESSLLHERYRALDIRGCDIFDGVLREMKPPEKRQRLDLLDDEEETNETRSEKPPSVVAIHGVSVAKCQKTNQWVASLSMNGNQVFLGSFPTESQAWLATRKAREANVEVPNTLLEAQQADIQGVSMETIIDAYEAHYDPTVNGFSP
ncbi:hypothetical protein MHU86_14476 [Fragilaria crotonensis]|nr:hypothetical protein MHU86_14476 [Fragilaria crotonensis]